MAAKSHAFWLLVEVGISTRAATMSWRPVAAQAVTRDPARLRGAWGPRAQRGAGTAAWAKVPMYTPRLQHGAGNGASSQR